MQSDEASCGTTGGRRQCLKIAELPAKDEGQTENQERRAAISVTGVTDDTPGQSDTSDFFDRRPLLT
jgi:hypothetical protein